ncbi:MAG: General stress protein CTC [candidate division BRC1 bacterium ADurb.BinA364]|nr:MAG: General stress protein CTC [candidate division BRC1 bacterium ADurb.BinA364]
MPEITIAADVRAEFGKGPGRRLRMEGRIPAILYGADSPNKPLSLLERDLAQLLHAHGSHSIISMAINEGGQASEEMVMLTDLQRHPVTSRMVHADFIRIRMDHPIHVTVQIIGHGVPVGVREQGGVLDRPVREISLRCLPGDMPNDFDVDISNLRINETIRVSDLPIDREKLAVLTDEDSVLFSIAPTRASMMGERPEAEEGAEEEAEEEAE